MQRLKRVDRTTSCRSRGTSLTTVMSGVQSFNPVQRSLELNVERFNFVQLNRLLEAVELGRFHPSGKAVCIHRRIRECCPVSYGTSWILGEGSGNTMNISVFDGKTGEGGTAPETRTGRAGGNMLGIPRPGPARSPEMSGLIRPPSTNDKTTGAAPMVLSFSKQDCD